MNKLFYSLTNRLDNLLKEHTDLYFKERPWIEKPTFTHEGAGANGEKRMITENTPYIKLDFSNEIKQNELEQGKVIKKNNLLLNPPKPIEDVDINGIFGPYYS